MKKELFNEALRIYSKKEISPTSDERNFVSEIYSAFTKTLGDNNCFQIGSYPRFTAITPLHDLDILYVIGSWDHAHLDPKNTLQELQGKIEREFKNPTQYQYAVSLQTHSVTISFFNESKKVFSVDVVPAYTSGKINEYGNDIHYVPEVAIISPAKREDFYTKQLRTQREMQWIKSDPKGYIEVAKRTNQANPDFRKAVKLVKHWKQNAKSKNDDFKLKSFHIEQVLTGYFQGPGMTVFDALFRFFSSLESVISKPQIVDRASSKKFIDEYVVNLSESEKELILQYRDGIMISLESLNDPKDIDQLFMPRKYKRKSREEQYLFDLNIKTCIDPKLILKIDGCTVRKDGFQTRCLRSNNFKVKRKRELQFKITKDTTWNTSKKWKVKNADNSQHPRGEISDGSTKNNPESTEYIGDHYVECFAITENTCIAKDKIDVFIRQ